MSIQPLGFAESEKWKRIAADILDVDREISAFFTLSALEKKQWIPAICEGDFRDGEKRKYASDFATACMKSGFERAVCLDVDSGSAQGVALDLSRTDLIEVHNLFLVPSYCVVEEQGRFALISDSDYFWGVAGKRHFIETALKGQSSHFTAEVSNTGDLFFRSGQVERRRLGANLKAYVQIIDQAQAAIATNVE